MFSVPELVLWCSKRFDTTSRVIQVGEVSFPPLRLSLIVFQSMLRLPKKNKELKELKLVEVDSFIANNGGMKKLLSHFKDSLSGIKPNTS